MLKYKCYLIFILVNIIFVSIASQARLLNAVEIYRRCYAQLTQRAVPYNDPVLGQIKTGAKLPVVACMELLDLAKFNSINGNRLQNDTNATAINILNTMNQLHQTFFLIKGLAQTAQEIANRGMIGMYDAGEPALFYTKALFDSGTPFDSIVTSNYNLRADRTQNAPLISSADYNRTTSIFSSDVNFSWASIGSLLGVNITGPLPITSSFGSANIGASSGGGILGSPAYLLSTVNEAPNFKANTFTMPRKWAKSVFSDFLCRELPVARLVDTNAFVNNAANANEFRKSQSCTQCHASMDRLAAVNRNFKYQVIVDAGNFTSTGGVFPIHWPTNASLDGSAWPAVPTGDYSSRPTLGVLYYRDYKGVLVNQGVNSISDLGSKLALQDDFYICAAKKYYQYFTGVNVDILDPEDSRNRNKGSDMQVHKTNVITLGLTLKNDKNLRNLINGIFNLEVYKKSDLGIQGL